MTGAAGTISKAAVQAWIRGFAARVSEQRAYLVELDTAIGDGDHGTNMDRGMKKALEKLEASPDADIGATLKTVGMALVSSVGGAAGPLYGTLFLQMGTAAGSTDALDVGGWADAVDAGVKGVQARGKAQAGDKTMLDTLLPAVEALRAAQAEGLDAPAAARRAAAAGEEGMRSTTEMEARKGRASYLGPRSVGHQDPGATSSYLLLSSAAEAFEGS